MTDRTAWTAERIVDWRRWLANRDFAVTQGAMEQALDEIEARGKEIERLREIERIAIEFCAKVESGEARSVRTYAAFKTALAAEWAQESDANA